jgi:hypothetical protein
MLVLKGKLRHKRRSRREGLSTAPAQTAAGESLTFRAELMPGRSGSERTFTVERVLDNGRVELRGLSGQHSMTEFEPVR